VPSLQVELQEVLDLQPSWAKTATPPMKRRGELIWGEIPSRLREPLPDLARSVPSISDLRIEGRDNTGNKSQIPWVRIYSAKLSPTAQQGWYVVYLFSADGERLFLSLGHGSTRNAGTHQGLPNFRPRSSEELQRLVAWAREKLPEEASSVPGYTTTIQLHARTYLGPSYERGTVCAVEYLCGELPDDERLFADLRHMLRLLDGLYRAQVEDPAMPGKPPVELEEVLGAVETAAAPSRAKSRGSRQGYGLTQAERSAVEGCAMRRAAEVLAALGYKSIRDVSLTKSYDLETVSGEGRLCVEVKGTTSDGRSILLTPNEVALHQDQHPANALIVISNIVLKKGEIPTASGGTARYWIPWTVESSRMRPVGYEYQVDFDTATEHP
jgi:hypothetical protein